MNSKYEVFVKATGEVGRVVEEKYDSIKVRFDDDRAEWLCKADVEKC